MLYLIVNPVAGRGRAASALERTRAFLDAEGVPYDVLVTERPGHATDLARATPEGATVVAMGGDGTVHEVARGILHADPAFARGPGAASLGAVTTGQAPGAPQPGRVLATLPVGSGDDFAFSLGIPRDDLSAALARLLRGSVHRIDVGVVDHEPFVNALGVGFDAEVAHRVALAPKLFKGLGAYLYAVVTTLGRLDPCPVTVTIDGTRVYQGRALLVACQNGPRTGGSFLFAPDARNDDGVLDVIVAGDFGKLGTLGILPSVMRGRHLGHPKVHLFRGREVSLAWERPQHAHAEGEQVPPAATFNVSLRPAALSVLR